MNKNLDRRIHPIAEADGLSPKKPRKFIYLCLELSEVYIVNSKFLSFEHPYPVVR